MLNPPRSGVRYRVPVLICAAHAKLNLSLCVGPPEPQGGLRAGYHRIVSWMHAIELADEIRLSRVEAGENRFTVRWAADALRPSAIDWPIEKDLAVKAHAALERVVGFALPVELEVVKRIPVGGGLGGGSSDAAATILGLIDLFRLRVSDEQLLDVAMSLGSDVAFFGDRGASPPRPAIVTGFGETLRRVGSLNRDVVLVIPPFGCETRAVYRAFDWLLAGGEPAANLAADDRAHGGRERFDPEVVLAGDYALRNDLRAAAEAVAPGLAAIRRVAPENGGPLVMSGSGSTLFALVPPGEGKSLAVRLRAADLPLGTLVTATRLVG